jgi:mono/diheme cytochrome c family protein
MKSTCGLRASLLAASVAFASFTIEANAQNTQQSWSDFEQYCLACHNSDDWAGGVAFDLLSPDHLADEAHVWEQAIRKLRGGLMPPPGAERPPNETVEAMASWLATSLDASSHQYLPERIPLRRLNRREYAYAVRDLLGMNINVNGLLPADDIKGGFDNNASALQVSPAFIDQYLNAARTVAHQAVGDPRPIPVMETYGNVADMIISLPPRGTPGVGNQQRHTPGMPFGTRGGMSITHTFLADGEYELTIGDLALAREVPKLEFEHTLVALLNGQEFFRTSIGGEGDHKAIDQIQDDAVAMINDRLRGIRFHAPAGQHNVTVTFIQRSLAESDERTRIAALDGGQDRVPGVHALQIRGPLHVTGMSESESRRRIFVCYPNENAEESACARQIITHLAERAFRRPLTDEDTGSLLAFYQNSRQTQGFEASIRDVVSAILVSPHFIYRAEGGLFSTEGQALSSLELASRLSFFLWSSVPDEQLLVLANNNELLDPAVLRTQIRRMLADPRARSLIDDFAFQWLGLSRLDEITPDPSQFRHATRFLDPRAMFKEELSLFIDSVLRSEQPVTRLLDADYTYLNERLAMHYGIEGVKGSRFRQVSLADPARHGLLGKGAVLMMTANPNRTSPVLRGDWILKHILGTPPGEPPPNVEAFPENAAGQPARTVRERLAQHAANPSCFGCHGVMDPLGLALENFDTVGQFRTHDPLTFTAIDTSGVLPGGMQINGPADLATALVARSDMFVQTLTENLMAYALGREISHHDMPGIRSIVRTAAEDNYRFESIVFSIVASDAFRLQGNRLSDTASDNKVQASR